MEEQDKTELETIIEREGTTVLCAKYSYTEYDDEGFRCGTTNKILKRNYTKDELSEFFERVRIEEYDSLSECAFIIWLSNGSWITVEDWEGYIPQWRLHKCPEIDF